MDIVIPLGTGSTWDNNELRFALRSLEMYCKNVDNVYLVGEKPHWIKKGSLIHLPYPDREGMQHKEYNIYNKILHACMHPALTENFLFMNDDHYLLSPIPPLERYYQNMLPVTLALRSAHDSYYQSINNTVNALRTAFRPLKNFDIHCPIVYNKTRFRAIMARYDWSQAYGYLIKSLYCNSAGYTGRGTTDLKINQRYPCSVLDELVKGRKFFSIGDGATGAEMWTFLNYLYRNKSKYEL